MSLARITLAVLVAALIPAASLAWNTRHFEHLGYFHDDGMYLLAGKSLAEGQGYLIPSFPGTPYQTKYPPILPLLLAVVWKVFPEFPANMPWAMLIVAAMLPAFAWVSVRLLESWGCSRPAAMLVCAWMVLNPYIIFFSVNLMPELLVATLLGCCLLAAQKAAQHNSSRMALAAGILAGLANLTKTAAMPLLAAGPIWFALRRKFRLAVWFEAPLLASVVAWSAWSVLHTAPPTDIVAIYYTSYIGDFLFDLRPFEWATFIWFNIPTLLGAIGNLLIPDMLPFPVIGANFSRVVGLFAVAGLVRQVRHSGMGLHHWFAACFSVLLVVWHYPPNERFLIPMLPVLAHGALTELQHLTGLIRSVRRSPKRDQRVAAGIFAALLAVLGLWAVTMVGVGHRVLLPTIAARYKAQSESSVKVYAWIKANLAAAEPVFTGYDAAAFLYTGHLASRLPNVPKAFYRDDKEAVARTFAELPAFARSRGIRYLILNDTDLDLDPFTKENMDWKKLIAEGPYRLLTEEPMTRLYEITPQ